MTFRFTNSQQITVLCLILLFGFELRFQTAALESGHYYQNGLFHILSGLLIGFLVIRQGYIKDDHDNPLSFRLNYKLAFAWAIIPLYLIGLSLVRIFSDYADLEKFSDVLPMIKTLNERLLHGEYPYQMVTKWGYDFFPTFLPLHWLPFSLGMLWKFDMRWVGYIAWCVAVLIAAGYYFARTEKLSARQLLVPATFLIIPACYLRYEPIPLGVTAEMLIAAYYILLATAIWTRNVWLTTLALVFCLLSRYSIVLFLPLLGLVYAQNFAKKDLIRAGVLLIAGVLLFYVIPFMIKDPLIFFKSYDHYTKATLPEWKGQPWQEAGSKPYSLFRGLGLAAFIYDFTPGQLEEKVELARKLHLGFVLATTGLLTLLYWRTRKNLTSSALFLLGGMKVYLTVFYAFIQIPYSYLYLMPVCISAFCIMAVSKEKATGQ